MFDYDFRKFLDEGNIRAFAESCKFAVHYVYLYEDKYDRQKLVEIAKKLCEAFCSDLPRYDDYSIPQVTFVIDGERAFDADIFKRDYVIEIDVSEFRDGRPMGYEEISYNYATDEITVTPREPK